MFEFFKQIKDVIWAVLGVLLRRKFPDAKKSSDTRKVGFDAIDDDI
jgi:hypothetical protein